MQPDESLALLEARESDAAIADLIDINGTATARARDLIGATLDLAGYVAPSLVPEPRFVLLTEGSLAPCLLCGSTHGAGA